uniref:Uncharacterized protein n=1 Tax=Anguilla anguilla TaxID=7936 RepID=A0A0E9VW42_ANGAN
MVDAMTTGGSLPRALISARCHRFNIHGHNLPANFSLKSKDLQAIWLLCVIKMLLFSRQSACPYVLTLSLFHYIPPRGNGE